MRRSRLGARRLPEVWRKKRTPSFVPVRRARDRAPWRPDARASASARGMNHRSWRVRARGPARRARPRRARAFHAFVQSCAFGERTTRTAREARRARGRRRRRETRSCAVVSLARGRERNDAAIARETRTTGATPWRLSPKRSERTTDERRIFVQARRPCTRRSRRISRGSSANGRFTRTRRDQKDLGLPWRANTRVGG